MQRRMKAKETMQSLRVQGEASNVLIGTLTRVSTASGFRQRDGARYS